MNGQIFEVEAIMDEPTVDQSARADRVAALLAGGVPLTLLADLAESNGPISPAILVSEGLPDDAWWEAGGEGAKEARATPDDAGKAPGTGPDTASR
jgi:ABC-type sugar transport system substrate-binding protein